MLMKQFYHWTTPKICINKASFSMDRVTTHPQLPAGYFIYTRSLEHTAVLLHNFFNANIIHELKITF
jgi:hypothetical protein